MTTDKIFKLTSSVGFIGLLVVVLLMATRSCGLTGGGKGGDIQDGPRRAVAVHHYYDSTVRVVPGVSAPGTVSFYPAPVPGGIGSGTLGTGGTIDTAVLMRYVRDYFAVRTYSQEIRDTAIVATIFDSISQNRRQGRRFSYKLIGPARTVESSTVFAPQRGFYLGGFASASKSQFGIGPSVSFITKKEALLNARFDFINRAGMFGAEFKLR